MILTGEHYGLDEKDNTIDCNDCVCVTQIEKEKW